jgi:hypothetical protein
MRRDGWYERARSNKTAQHGKRIDKESKEARKKSEDTKGHRKPA